MNKYLYNSFFVAVILHCVVVSSASILYHNKFDSEKNKIKEKDIIKISKFMLNKKTVSDSVNENVVEHEVQSNILGSENNLPKESVDFQDSVSSEEASDLASKKSDSDYSTVGVKKEKSSEVSEQKSISNIKTKKFKYFKFYKENKVKIDKIWDKLLSKNKFKKKDELEVLVLLKVDQSGKILDISIDKSSLNGKFDNLALNVFKKNNKIIAPPLELFDKNEYLYIQWYFSLKN